MTHVLIIEDNRDHLELMAYLLRVFGYRPYSAGSGEAALGLLQQRAVVPDLIICDLWLPSMSGLDVATALRQYPRWAKIPLVATSAAVTDRNAVLAAGFDGFVPKPIVPETFAAEVSAFLKLDQRGTAPPAPVSGAPAAPSQHPAGRNRCTILAVDDRPQNLELLRCMLEPFGYKVVTATGVREGLTRAREIFPDLILTDVHMGDGTGFDLVKATQSDPALRGIAWIVTTATYLEMDPRAAALGLCETNFILWPIEPEALIARIEASLAGKPKGMRGQSGATAEHG